MEKGVTGAGSGRREWREGSHGREWREELQGRQWREGGVTEVGVAGESGGVSGGS